MAYGNIFVCPSQNHTHCTVELWIQIIVHLLLPLSWFEVD